VSVKQTLRFLDRNELEKDRNKWAKVV